MTRASDSPLHEGSLRKKAEKKLRLRKKSDLNELSAEDAARLIHELQVHQIELEMQNEELRLAHVELEKSRSKYSDLYDFAPVGYFTFDANGLILGANLTGAALLGIERSRILKKPFSTYIGKEYQHLFFQHRRKVLDTNERQTCEMKMKRKGGGEFHVQLESIRVEDVTGKRVCRSWISDISAHKLNEERASKLLEELTSVFNNIPIGIVYLDNKFRIIHSNRFFNEFTGFKKGELTGKLCYEIVGEYSHDSTRKDLEKVCSFCKKDECCTYKRPTVMERPLMDKYIRVTTIPEVNEKGEIYRFMEIVEDITKDRLAMAEIESLSRFASENPNPVLRISSGKTVLYKNEAVNILLKENGLPDNDVFRILPKNIGVLIDESLKKKQRHYLLEVNVSNRVFSYNLIPVAEHQYVNLYGRDITARKKAETSLYRIEWLLKKSLTPKTSNHEQPYGNLTELNTSRVLKDALSEGMLADIAGDYLDLLDTSAAVYEKNGDYALGIFSSGWCRFLDNASRNLCETSDNRKALASGKWHCHESCWTDASRVAVESGQPVDIECRGGIRLYSVPIRAGSEIVGAINFGYGDPPADDEKLLDIAERYRVSMEALKKYARAYASRPPFIIEIAKRRLITSANLFGVIVERKQAEHDLQKAKDELEMRVEERTADLKKSNVLLNKEITERRKAEEQIKRSLEEKEVLLKEIHHRVKNNMTVISSLLRLQADKVREGQYREMFDDGARRIKTMALIHENLYRSEDWAKINFGDYIGDMINNMYMSYGLNQRRIQLKKDIEGITLGVDTAIPCGLIVNELLSNALKYAFPEGRSGEIRVSLRKSDKDEVELTVSDNGIGMPDDLDFKDTDTLGLHLVNALVMQLQGEIELNREQGTDFHIRFRRH